jgi:diamine N-acetyltransferase
MDRLLSTVRIRLRALEPEDLDFLYRWENDDRLWAFGSTLTPFSKFVLRQYIENSGQDLYEAKQLRLVIVENATNMPIGTIDLYPSTCGPASAFSSMRNTKNRVLRLKLWN